MFAEYPQGPNLGETPRHVAILGVISFFTAMSSAMVYGLLPVFLVCVLGASAAAHVLWSASSPEWEFGFSALIGMVAIVVLSIRPALPAAGHAA